MNTIGAYSRQLMYVCVGTHVLYSFPFNSYCMCGCRSSCSPLHSLHHYGHFLHALLALRKAIDERCMVVEKELRCLHQPSNTWLFLHFRQNWRVLLGIRCVVARTQHDLHAACVLTCVHAAVLKLRWRERATFRLLIVILSLPIQRTCIYTRKYANTQTHMHVHLRTRTHTQIGPLWDFRNASARQYYVDQVIGEVTSNESSALNMVFFDGGLGFLVRVEHVYMSMYI